MTKGYRILVTVPVPIAKKIKEEAERNQTSMSAVVRIALSERYE